MNDKLNMQDFVDLLAEKHGLGKKDADEFVKEFFLLIEQALESDKCVKIKGLGTFKLIEVDSRESVNVHTGERFEIQEHTKVSFAPDVSLRDVINKPFAHFETVVLNESTVLDDTHVEEVDEEVDEAVEVAVVPEKVSSIEEPSEKEIEPIAPEEPVRSMEEIPEEVLSEDEEVLSEAAEVLPTVEPERESMVEEIIAAELLKADREFKNALLQEKKPIASSSDRQPSQSPVLSKQNSKSPVAYLVTIIILVLLLCSSALLFVYYPDLFSSASDKEIAQTAANQPVAAQPKLIRDTVAAVIKRDTVAEAIPEVKKQVPIELVKAEPKLVAKPSASEKPSLLANSSTPVKPDSVTYKITGTKTTYTIKEGETLTRVSLRFYGTKDLWPYIVQHNRSIIKNPDNVPYGTTLKIPELIKR